MSLLDPAFVKVNNFSLNIPKESRVVEEFRDLIGVNFSGEKDWLDKFSSCSYFKTTFESYSRQDCLVSSVVELYQTLLICILKNQWKIPITGLIDMHFDIFEKHCKGKEYHWTEREISWTIPSIVDVIVVEGSAPSLLVNFFTRCIDIQQVDFETIFGLLCSDSQKYVLECFAEEHFHGWNIKKGKVLTDGFYGFCEETINILLKHGFKYPFEEHFKMKCHLFGAVSEPKFPDFRLNPDIAECGNLRLQLAISLLLVIFAEDIEDKRYREELLMNHGHKGIMSMIWSLYPYPFITAYELFILLKPFVNEYDGLEYFCSEYAKRNTIFEVPDVPQPRSLKHLSRCQVRDNFNRANSLCDERIGKLDIPATLISYLRLEELRSK